MNMNLSLVTIDMNYERDHFWGGPTARKYYHHYGKSIITTTYYY